MATIIATVSIAEASDKADRIENEFGVPADLVASRPGLGLWVVFLAGVGAAGGRRPRAGALVSRCRGAGARHRPGGQRVTRRARTDDYAQLAASRRRVRRGARRAAPGVVADRHAASPRTAASFRSSSPATIVPARAGSAATAAGTSGSPTSATRYVARRAVVGGVLSRLPADHAVRRPVVDDAAGRHPDHDRVSGSPRCSCSGRGAASSVCRRPPSSPRSLAAGGVPVQLVPVRRRVRRRAVPRCRAGAASCCSSATIPSWPGSPVHVATATRPVGHRARRRPRCPAPSSGAARSSASGASGCRAGSSCGASGGATPGSALGRRARRLRRLPVAPLR